MKWIIWPAVGLIRFHQIVGRRVMDGLRGVGVPVPACSLTPTCSEYAIIALREHGLLRGLRMIWGRLLLCERGVVDGAGGA
jgi:putative component of membrane protein insertase Oxa1/YidC/SpoIIIJ protein YidD